MRQLLADRVNLRVRLEEEEEVVQQVACFAVSARIVSGRESGSRRQVVLER